MSAAVTNMVIGVVCGLGFAGAVSPTAERGITITLLALTAVAAVIPGLRWVARRRRERREDAADLVAGATWRAEHMPHLAAPLGRDQIRAGVA